MAAAQLAEMIGMDEGTASMYLEMAGGDIDAAMSLYFSMMDDGGGGGQQSDGGDDGQSGGGSGKELGFEAPDIYSTVWENASAPPPGGLVGAGPRFRRGGASHSAGRPLRPSAAARHPNKHGAQPSS